MNGRKRNIQIHCDIDDLAFTILKNKLNERGLSAQEFFQKKIKEPVRYIDTSHRFAIKEINSRFKLTGQKINDIGIRMKNENIYDSDVNAVHELINDVANLQTELEDVVRAYFKSMERIKF